jgi:hypothetical protein
MTDSFAPWFAPTFDSKRRSQLERFESFTEVLAFAQSRLSRIEARKKPGCADGLTDCWQPVFILYVDASSFDAFYNGPYGYRAQYAIDPDVGLAANGQVIRTLTDALLAQAALTEDLVALPVRRSLEAASAKIWPLEDDLRFDRFRRDLAVPRWVEAAERGSELAQMGLVAPEATVLEVKGALLDSFANEVVPASKVRRRHQIHEMGFT